MEQKTEEDKPDFSNAPFVRNMIEQARMAQAERLVNMAFEGVTADDTEIPVAQKKQTNIGFGG